MTMSMWVRSLVVCVTTLTGAAAASAAITSICPRTSGVAPSPSPFGSTTVRLQRSDRTVHVLGIRTLRLRIAGRIGARSIWRNAVLTLWGGAEFVGTRRGGALRRRRLTPGASTWSPVGVETLMVGARAATNAAVLHRVHGVATRVRVRMRRWGARWLETKMRGHHRTRRELDIFLACA